ncbi:MAG: hypothetical protein HKN13_13380, partial [Rhodothermales bacterium]|nr:hypothetical protein [Rhodothermales bacterium]
SNQPENDTPIVVKAMVPGTAVVRGSDVLADWQETGSPGVFEHTWTHDWGPAPNPWADDRELPSIVLRREMVFVDGSRLTQVIDRSDLRDGTFLVDDAGK